MSRSRASNAALFGDGFHLVCQIAWSQLHVALEGSDVGVSGHRHDLRIAHGGFLEKAADRFVAEVMEGQVFDFGPLGDAFEPG